MGNKTYITDVANLINEWDYEKNAPNKPENYTIGSGESVWWKCSKCGYSWQAKILNRYNGRGCPLCSNKAIVVGINDIATTHPEIAKEWHPSKNGALTPQNVTHGCSKKVWWLCPIGHEYQATVLHRCNGKTNCPICNSGRQTSFAEQAVLFYVKKIYSDAISRYKAAFLNKMELDIYIPSIKVAIEYDGVFWHKNNSQRELQKFSLCRQNGIKLIRLKEEFDSDNTFADYCISVEGLESMNSNDYTPLSNLIQLLLDHIDQRSNFWTRRDMRYIHSPVQVNIDKDEMEIRQNYMMALKADSLAQLRPDIAEEWHPTNNGTLTPNMFKINSGYKAWWKCKTCGNEWQTTIGHRTSGTGCNVCYRKNNKGDKIYNAKTIYQYSLAGDFIKEWDCISSASRALSINCSNISMCANHTRNNAGGFRWEYVYKEKLEPIVITPKSRKGLWGKAVLQLDKDGNIVNEYRSLNEASQALKIDPSNISKVLHGHAEKAGGYYWKTKQ